MLRVILKKRFLQIAVLAWAAATVCPLAWAFPRRQGNPFNLKDILARMNDAGKHLKTVSTDLEYTKVTVLVNDRSTEYGTLDFRKGKIGRAHV